MIWNMQQGNFILNEIVVPPCFVSLKTTQLSTIRIKFLFGIVFFNKFIETLPTINFHLEWQTMFIVSARMQINGSYSIGTTIAFIKELHKTKLTIKLNSLGFTVFLTRFYFRNNPTVFRENQICFCRELRFSFWFILI